MPRHARPARVLSPYAHYRLMSIARFLVILDIVLVSIALVVLVVAGVS